MFFTYYNVLCLLYISYSIVYEYIIHKVCYDHIMIRICIYIYIYTSLYIYCSIQRLSCSNGWFLWWKHLLKLMIWGVPIFCETTVYIYICIEYKTFILVAQNFSTHDHAQKQKQMPGREKNMNVLPSDKRKSPQIRTCIYRYRERERK